MERIEAIASLACQSTDEHKGSPVSWVLSEEGAGCLADALNEIEQTSAAYSSCRADLYSTRGQPPLDE